MAFSSRIEAFKTLHCLGAAPCLFIEKWSFAPGEKSLSRNRFVQVMQSSSWSMEVTAAPSRAAARLVSPLPHPTSRNDFPRIDSLAKIDRKP
jgi:hypothetical protein